MGERSERSSKSKKFPRLKPLTLHRLKVAESNDRVQPTIVEKYKNPTPTEEQASTRWADVDGKWKVGRIGEFKKRDTRDQCKFPGNENRAREEKRGQAG